eukprot:CAMPEP_0184314058 /NCGR_PEP_ID=MMETSP1049-20130417/70747_1 /TAXON_ID=77928 /ORGANISM="Proteomonas sulcata, Strain CCMP704" /LENGTH=218 /DNA_ID=CAMNT_0026631773 /DNA_START=144 /DNA_END=797 /DNA_ORIENTATION=-
MVHDFLGAMENPFRSHKLWKEADDDDIQEVLDALECFVLGNSQVCESVYQSMESELGQKDATLVKRMWCLQFVQPQHLDIKAVHRSHPALSLARKMLHRIQQVRSPQEKMECVFRAARIIFRMLNETAATGNSDIACADDFLPVFIYAVLKSQTPQLYSALEYMALFRRPSRLGGERHYYLVQLQTAVAFIEHMDGASLTIDPEEFDTSLTLKFQAWE